MGLLPYHSISISSDEQIYFDACAINILTTHYDELPPVKLTLIVSPIIPISSSKLSKLAIAFVENGC